MVPTFWPRWHLFNSYLNNGPSQVIPILGQMEDTPVQVSHLSSGGCHILGSTPGLTSIMAWVVTRIVAAFWCSSVDSNNGPSPGHSNLLSNRVTSVQVSYLCFPGMCHIWPRAAGLTSIMAYEVTRIVAPSCPPSVYLSPIRRTANMNEPISYFKRALDVHNY